MSALSLNTSKIVIDLGLNGLSAERFEMIKAEAESAIAGGEYSIDDCKAISEALEKAQRVLSEKKPDFEAQGDFVKKDKTDLRKRYCFFALKAVAAAAVVAIGYAVILGAKNWMAAARLRQMGREVFDMADAGSFTKERQCFPLKTEVDKAYFREWQFKKECPVLCDYVRYQFDNGYFNGMNPKAMEELMPGKSSLDYKETRDFYNHQVNELIPCVVSSMKPTVFPEQKIRTGECLDEALAASLTRNNIKDDSRGRSNDIPEWILKLRNLYYYGGEIDENYIVGKYKRGSKEETCKTILAATLRTNKIINAIAEAGKGKTTS